MYFLTVQNCVTLLFTSKVFFFTLKLKFNSQLTRKTKKGFKGFINSLVFDFLNSVFIISKTKKNYGVKSHPPPNHHLVAVDFFPDSEASSSTSK